MIFNYSLDGGAFMSVVPKRSQEIRPLFSPHGSRIRRFTGRGISAIVLFIIEVMCIAVGWRTAHSADLDESCTVSILNRNIQPKSDGRWVLPNVPANFGSIRARATCVRNGVTLSGESPAFTIPVGGAVDVPPITLGPVTPIPSSMSISAARRELLSPGASVQLIVTGNYLDAPSKDLTQATTGTRYNVSNPDIATVTESGLVTAVKSGIALIQAVHEGASALISIRVSFTNGIDSDRDGIPDDDELTLGLNPNNPVDALLDIDNDLLSNLQEYRLGTDIRKRDSDGDGLSDGEEENGTRGPRTNPLLADTDGDGVRDLTEILTGSDPTSATSINLGQALRSISLRPGCFSLIVNSLNGTTSTQLSVVGTLIDDTTIDLTAARTGTSYSSSDLSVCNFGGESGRVFGGANGTCTISATNNGFTSTAQGTVTSFTPTQLSLVNLPGYANDVAVQGEFAYVALGGSGVSVVGLSTERRDPVILSTLGLEGVSQAIEVIGNRAYVAAGAAGVHIVDITNPFRPSKVRTVSAGSNARGLKIVGSRIYVASGDGIQVLESSVPDSYSVVGSVAIGGTAWNLDIDVNRKILALASGTSGLFIVDITQATSPLVLSNIATGDARSVALKSTSAFVADRQNSMTSVDISNLQEPRVLSSTTRNLGGLLNDVVISEDFALGADVFFTNSVSIVDISNPSSLSARALLNFLSRDGNGMGIAVDSSYVYLATVRTGTDRGGSDNDQSRLYIGQYRPRVDTNGVPPTSQIIAPVANYEALEGETITVEAAASDDVGVRSVRFLVNGQGVSISTVAPYRYSYVVPTGVTSVGFGVQAIDIGGNTGEITSVSIRVSPDPLTVVSGRVVDIDNVPLVGATVTAPGGRSALTTSLGNFQISGVPTAAGSLDVTATYTDSQQQVYTGKVSSITPQRGGTTEVGIIEALPAQFRRQTGNLVSTADNSSFLQTLPFPFKFYGVDYTSVYVGTNGYLTFTLDDRTTLRTLPEFSKLPRISPFFDDFVPARGGVGAGVLVNRSLPGRFVVTYDRVGSNSATGENTVQVQLFDNGRIVFAYDGISALTAQSIVGLSPGPSFPLQEVNFLATRNQDFASITSLYRIFSRTSPFDLDRGFIIFSPLPAGGYNVRAVK
jgi:hypothetical protein